MNKLLNVLIGPVLIAPAIYLAMLWNSLPEKIAIHYNLSGEPDRYGGKNELLVMAAIIMAVNAVVYFLLVNAHRISTQKKAFENRDRLRRLAFAISVFISAIVFIFIYSSMHADMKLSLRIILVAVGLLLSIVGNYMHNIKPNYFAGFRISWTLNNEENWRKTHLLGGKLWFTGGLLTVIITLFSSPMVSIVSFGIIFLIMLIIPCVYSYRLYRKMKPL